MHTGLKVLVTGASGFLGPWLCEELLSKGHSVIALDRQFPNDSRLNELGNRVKSVDCDIEDFARLERVMIDEEVQFIFHLAAQALVGLAANDPTATFRSNIMGTWNVLEAMRLLKLSSDKLKGTIVTSSDKAYGDQPKLPYLEDAPMAGRFPYDVSKSCTDLIAQSYFQTYKLPICVTRCGNLYGGGDMHWSRIVPGTIKSILEGERPTIRSDGSPVRDYIFVKDAASAIVALFDAMLTDETLHGEAFNISNDQPLSVSAIVDEILAQMKSDLKPIIVANAPHEIQAQYLSSAKIRKCLGWQPAYDLKSGLGETIGWYANRFQKASIGR